MKKIAVAGASHRALTMYVKPLTEEFREHVKLVGIFDINRERARIVSSENGNIPVYDDFDKMLEECKPDAVIVTMVDRFHHEYIIKSLQAGCDAIAEKPMTIDEEKCRAILEAEKSTGRKVIVTFNVRFIPHAARIKQLLQEGVIGRTLSINLEWLLDTSHGADYFRRWHRYMENSGGLLVHKATHHYDLINWWLDEEPETVYAFGTRRFYGPTREKRGERCLTCDYKKTCEYYWDITANELFKAFYLQAEPYDGYIRDKCVFAEDIDIYDSMSVNVRYSDDTLLNYSLVAHSPYEGWKVSINGTEGRLEAEEFYSGRHAEDKSHQIRIYNRKGEVVTYEIQRKLEAHEGGDDKLRRMLFEGGVEDPLGQQAGSLAGAMSLLIGVAANKSIKEKRPVQIKDLL